MTCVNKLVIWSWNKKRSASDLYKYSCWMFYYVVNVRVGLSVHNQLPTVETCLSIFNAGSWYNNQFHQGLGSICFGHEIWNRSIKGNRLCESWLYTETGNMNNLLRCMNFNFSILISICQIKLFLKKFKFYTVTVHCGLRGCEVLRLTDCLTRIQNYII